MSSCRPPPAACALPLYALPSLPTMLGQAQSEGLMMPSSEGQRVELE